MPSVPASRTQKIVQGGGGEGHHHIQELRARRSLGHCWHGVRKVQGEV